MLIQEPTLLDHLIENASKSDLSCLYEIDQGYSQYVPEGGWWHSEKVTITSPKDLIYPLVDFKENFKISGMGRQTRETCNTIHPVRGGFMPENGKELPKIKFQTCLQQGCPECFLKWSTKAGKMAGDTLYENSKLWGVQLSHWVYSPAKRVTVKELKKNFKKVVKKYNVSNDLGYAYIVHPRRIVCLDCGRGTERMDGKRSCRSCGSDKLGWKYSPHVHFISNFRFGGNAVPGLGVDFVLVNISYKAGRLLSEREDMQNLCMYLLSHAYWKPKAHAISYCGVFSARYTKRVVKVVKEPVCDEDGSPYYAVQLREKSILVDSDKYLGRDSVEIAEVSEGRVYFLREANGDWHWSWDRESNRIPLLETSYVVKCYKVGSEEYQQVKICEDCSRAKECHSFCLTSDIAECPDFN